MSKLLAPVGGKSPRTYIDEAIKSLEEWKKSKAQYQCNHVNCNDLFHEELLKRLNLGKLEMVDGQYVSRIWETPNPLDHR